MSIFLNPKQFNNKKDLKTYPLILRKIKFYAEKMVWTCCLFQILKKFIIGKIKKLNFQKIKNIMEQKNFVKVIFLGVLNVMEKLLNIIKNVVNCI